MNKDKFQNLKGREFYGKIVKAYTGKLLGWYEVEIPQLLGKGNTIKARDESNKNLLDQNSGSYYPLLPGQNVIIKFSNDDINSAYIDRIANTIVYRMAPDKFGHYNYIVVQTPKDMKIHIDDESEEVKVIHKGAYNFIFLKNEGAQIHSETHMEVKSKDKMQIHSMEEIEMKFGKPNTESETTDSVFLDEILTNIDLSNAPYAKDIYIELKQSNGIVKGLEFKSKRDKRLAGKTISAIEDIYDEFGHECGDQISKKCCIKAYESLKKIEEIYNFYMENTIEHRKSVIGYYKVTRKDLIEYLAENCPEIVNNNWELPPDYYKYSEEYNKRLYKRPEVKKEVQKPEEKKKQEKAPEEVSLKKIQEKRKQEIKKIKKNIKNKCACDKSLLIPYNDFWNRAVKNYNLNQGKTAEQWLNLIARDINRIIHLIQGSNCCNRSNVCPEFGDILLQIANNMYLIYSRIGGEDNYQYYQLGQKINGLQSAANYIRINKKIDENVSDILCMEFKPETDCNCRNFIREGMVQIPSSVDSIDKIEELISKVKAVVMEFVNACSTKCPICEFNKQTDIIYSWVLNISGLIDDLKESGSIDDGDYYYLMKKLHTIDIILHNNFKHCSDVKILKDIVKDNCGNKKCDISSVKSLLNSPQNPVKNLFDILFKHCFTDKKDFNEILEANKRYAKKKRRSLIIDKCMSYIQQLKKSCSDLDKFKDEITEISKCCSNNSEVYEFLKNEFFKKYGDVKKFCRRFLSDYEFYKLMGLIDDSIKKTDKKLNAMKTAAGDLKEKYERKKVSAEKKIENVKNELNKSLDVYLEKVHNNPNVSDETKNKIKEILAAGACFLQKNNQLDDNTKSKLSRVFSESELNNICSHVPDKLKKGIENINKDLLDKVDKLVEKALKSVNSVKREKLVSPQIEVKKKIKKIRRQRKIHANFKDIKSEVVKEKVNLRKLKTKLDKVKKKVDSINIETCSEDELKEHINNFLSEIKKSVVNEFKEKINKIKNLVEKAKKNVEKFEQENGAPTPMSKIKKKDFEEHKSNIEETKNKFSNNVSKSENDIKQIPNDNEKPLKEKIKEFKRKAADFTNKIKSGIDDAINKVKDFENSLTDLTTVKMFTDSIMDTICNLKLGLDFDFNFSLGLDFGDLAKPVVDFLSDISSGLHAAADFLSELSDALDIPAEDATGLCLDFSICPPHLGFDFGNIFSALLEQALGLALLPVRMLLNFMSSLLNIVAGIVDAIKDMLSAIKLGISLGLSVHIGLLDLGSFLKKIKFNKCLIKNLNIYKSIAPHLA